MRMSPLVACAALLAGSCFAAEPSSQSLSTEFEHGFAPSLAPAYITDLQQLLVARGYYAGPIDGRMNGPLRAAVSVYQSDIGLRVTGVPDLAVVNMLHFGPNVHATIQPLGEPAKPAAAASGATRIGVPPYERIEPYRYPSHAVAADTATEEGSPSDAIGCDGAAIGQPGSTRTERRVLRVAEPPQPKPAPQARVVAQPLNPLTR